MREIKFRAWDEKHGSMVTWDQALRNFKMDEYFIPMSDFVLMQYTGLKDRNGKEIYELDKLRCEDSNSDYPIYALVEWDDEYGRWNATTDDNGESCEYELWALLEEFQFVDVEGNKWES